MDLEAEYNNVTKIPGFGAIVASWTPLAEAFRAAHPTAELDLPYGPTPRQALDLFWPDRPDPPIALFIHGGYWQRLSKSPHSHLAAGLLAHGVAVAMPSYDLCPDVTVATIADQLRTCAAFLARRHGKPLLAIGHSAGGHLAAMLLATDWTARDLPGDTVASALPISGLFDLTPLVHTSINTALGLDEAEARRLSPAFLPTPNKPLHCFVGDEGPEYARQTTTLAKAWHGRETTVPGTNHLTIIDELTRAESPMVEAALALMPK